MRNEIIILEKKYWDAIANHDFETVKELTFFPCITAGKRGIKSLDEDTFAQIFDQSKDLTLRALNISDEEVTVISEGYVVLGYTIMLERTVNGRTTHSKCACTSAWARIDGSWKCPLHTESELA